MSDELLTPEEIALRLRISDEYAKKLMRHRMVHLDLGEGLVRVTQAVLQ